MKEEYPKKEYKTSRGLRGNNTGTNSKANVAHLTRILLYLETKKYCYKNEIRYECGMDSSHINSALVFLVNHNLLSKIGITCRDYYCLKKYEEEVIKILRQREATKTAEWRNRK